MKFQKKYIFIFLLVFFSIALSTYLWPTIKFPLTRNDIFGIYLINNHSPLNDVARYIIFIFIPFSVFLITKLILFKIPFSQFMQSFKSKPENIVLDKKLNYLLYFFFLYLIFEFISLSFPLHTIDIYHEGQKMSSAYKSLLDDSLWTGSYVTVGIIYETIGSKLIWQLFNNVSIGLVRFLDLIYIFITKTLLVLLLYEISKTVNFKTTYKLIFFFIITILCMSLISYNSQDADNIHFREIPILISLIFFIKSLNKTSIFYNIIFGFLSIFVFIWSIDRGIVFLIFLILFCIFLLFNNRYRDTLNIIASIIFFWTIFYFTQMDEFFYFLNNTYLVFAEHMYIGGLIHPTPFFDGENSSRATKSILVILFSLIFSINYLLNTKLKYQNNFKFILLFLSIICFLSYTYALGRSDGPHIKQSFAFPSIFLIITIFYFLVAFVSDLKIKYFENSKFFISIPFIIVIILIGFKSNFTHVLNYKDRLANYISLKDEKFLNENDKIFVETASNILRNEKCIQLFTNDAALLYLLRKPSCTKFYFFYSIGSPKNQLDLVNNLNSKNYLIVNGTTDKWSPQISERYPILNETIQKYTNEIIVGDRIIKFK